MVRARFVLFIIPFLLLTSAIIAQEPKGLLGTSLENAEIANGALPSEVEASYTGTGASFNVDFMGQFANGSSWSDSTTSLAEDLTPGTSFSAINGSGTVEWTAYVLISPPYNISLVNLTLTNIPASWSLSDVLDSSSVSRYPSIGIDAASGQVNVSSSVIDVFGIWCFTFTDSNGATNLECGINAGGYTTTRSYEVGDFASFRGTAPVTPGSRMRLYLTDPLGITRYAADQTQSGIYFEWTSISIQSSWPAGVWYADVEFNNTGGASPTFVGRYRRSFNVTHVTGLSLRSPGDAVGDFLSTKSMGDLLYVSLDMIDIDNSEPVPGAMVTLNWTSYGTPVTHTMNDYGNGTYGIALNTTDLDAAGRWHINIDATHDFYTAPPTLTLDLDLYDPTELTYKSVYSTPIGSDFTATLVYRDKYTGMPLTGASIVFANGTAANVVNEANGEYNITVSSTSLALGEHWYIFNASKPGSYVNMASVNVTFLLRTHLTASTVSGNLTIPFGFNTSLSVVLVDLETGSSVGIGDVSSFSFTSSYGTQDYTSPTSFELALATDSWNVEQVSVTLSILMSSSVYSAPLDYTFNITVRPHFTLININGNLTKPYGQDTPLTVILLDMDTGENLGIGNVDTFIFSSSYGTEFFTTPSSFDITLTTNTWLVGATSVTITATLSSGDYLQPSGYVFDIVMRLHSTAVSVGGDFLVPIGANANLTVILIDLDLNVEVPIADVASLSFTSSYGTEAFNNPSSYDVMLSTNTWAEGLVSVNLSVSFSSSIYAAPVNFEFDIQMRTHYTSLSINGTLTTRYGLDTPLYVVFLDLDTGQPIDINGVSTIRFNSVHGTQDISSPSSNNITLDTSSWSVGKVLVTLTVIGIPSTYEYPGAFVFEVTIRAHFTSASITANLTHAYGGDLPVSIHLVDVDTGLQVPIGDVGSFTFSSSYGNQIQSSPASFDTLLDCDTWLVGTIPVNLSAILSNSIYYNPANFTFSIVIRPHYTSAAISGNLTIPYGFNTSLTVVLMDLDAGFAVDIGEVGTITFSSTYGTQDYSSLSSFDITLETDSWSVGTTNVNLSISMATTIFANPSNYTFEITVRMRRTAVYVQGELIAPYGMDTNISVVLLDMDSGVEIDINDVDTFSFTSVYGTEPFSAPTSYDVTLSTDSWSVGLVTVTLSISLSAAYYSNPTDYVFEVRIRSHITSAWVVGELTTPSGEDTSVTVFVKDLDTEAFVAISDVASISFTSSYGTDMHSTPASYTINLPTSSWAIGSWLVNLSISLSSTTLDDPENHSFIVIIRYHLTSVTVQGNLTTPYGLDTPVRVVLTDLDTGLLIDVSNVALFNFSSSYTPQVFNSPGSYDVLLQTDTWTVGATSVTLNVSLSGSIYSDPLGYVFDVVIRPHFTAASVLRDLQTPHGTDTDLTVVIIDLDLGTQIDIGNVSLIEFSSIYPLQQFSSPSSPNITLGTGLWDLGTEVVTMTIAMAGTTYSAPNDFVFDIFIRKHDASVSVSGNLTIPYGVDTQLTVVLTDLDTMSSIPIGNVVSFNFSSLYGTQGAAPTGFDVTLNTDSWDIGATLVTLDVAMQTSSIYFDPENFTFSINVRRHFTAASVSGELVVLYGNETHLSVLLLDLDTGATFPISNVSSFVFDSTHGPQNFIPPSSYDVILTTDTWSVGVTEVTLSVLYSSSILNAPDDLVFNVTIRAHYTSINVLGGLTTLYGFDTPLTVEVTDLDTGFLVDIADISEFNFTSIYTPQVFSLPASYDVTLGTDTWDVGTVSISLTVAIGSSIYHDPSAYSFDLNITMHHTSLSASGDFTIPYGEDVSLVVLLIDSDLGISLDISDVAWIFFASVQGDKNETAPTGFGVILGTSSWSLGTTLVTVSVGLSNTVYDLPDSYEFNVTVRMHYTAVSVSGNLQTPRGENTTLTVILIDLDTGLDVPIGAVDDFSFISGYGTESFSSPVSYGLQLTTAAWVVGQSEVNLSVSLAVSIYENPLDFTFNITIRLRYTSATVSGTLVVPYAFDTNLTVIILDLDSGTFVDETNVASIIFDSNYGSQAFTTYNLTLGTSTWDVGMTALTLVVSLTGLNYDDPANYTFTIEIRPHMTAVSVKGVVIQPYGNQTPLSVVLLDLDTMNPIAISNIANLAFDSSYGIQNFASPSSYDVVLATNAWLVGVTEVTLSVLFLSSTLDGPNDFVFNVTIRAHYTSINVKGSMTTLHGFDTPLTVEVTDLDTGLLVDIADISEFNFTSIYGAQAFSSPSSYDVTLATDAWDVGIVSISLSVAISGSIHYGPSAYSFDLYIITHRTAVSVSGDFLVPYGEEVTLTVLLIDSDLGVPVAISDVAWIFFTSVEGDQNETVLGSFDITLSTSSWNLGTTQVTVSVGMLSDIYELPNNYAFNVTVRMHYTAVSVSGDLVTPRGENTPLDVVLIDLDTGLAVPIGAVNSLTFTSEYGTEPFASPASYDLQLTTDTWGVGSKQVNLSASLTGSIYENPLDFTFNITIRLRYTSATVSGNLVVPYAFDTNLTVIVLDLDSGTIVDEINVDLLTFDSIFGAQGFTTYNLTLATNGWNIGPTTVTLAVSLAGSDYADPTNHTFTLEIRPHLAAVSVKGVVIQPYGNQTPLSVVLTDLDTMNPIDIANVASFTFDSSYGPQSMPSPSNYNVTLDTSLWSVGTASVTLSVAIAASYYSVPGSHVFQVTIRSLRIQLDHEPSDLIFPNGDDFRLVLGVKVTEPGPFYNDSLAGLLQSEFSVSGYDISITEIELGRYRLIISESYFTKGNYTIQIVIDPMDSRYSTDLLAVYFMYTPARSFLSSPNYPQVTTPYGADVNITLEYTDVDRGVGITGATMTPEGIFIAYSEHPTIQGRYIVTLIVTSLETGSYSFNITAEAADYENKTLSFILLVRVVYTYAIPTVAALDIPVGNSPVFYVEYWDVDHDISVSNETPFLVTGTWSSFTVVYEPGAPRPRYKITFITLDDTPLEQNRVVTFNFSKGVNYQAGVFTVTVTIRTHNTNFRLVSAVEPTSYKALLNISVYYGDLDNLVGIQHANVNHYVVGESGLLVSTFFNDTLLGPGYYLVQINATEFGGLGLQSLTIYFNWTGAVQKYHNLTLLVSANIIGAESSYTLLSASEPTPYLDNMSYLFLYKDLYTGTGITNISYGSGNVHIFVAIQELVVDLGQVSIWEVDPILFPGRYSVEFNTSLFGLVGAIHMAVHVNWSSGAEPYYTNRTDIITVRILPRDTLVSVIPPSPTSYGENATFSFTFDDVTGGLSESIQYTAKMNVTLGISDFTLNYNSVTRIFTVSFNTSQLVTDSVGQVPFTLDVEWYGEPFYANRTGRIVFVSIIQRLTILEYTSPPPTPYNDVVTFTVTWTDVTGALPRGVSGAMLTLYDGPSGPEIGASFYSWIDLNDGRYQVSLNSSYAGFLGTYNLNVTLATSLFYLANRTAIRSFVVGSRTAFLSSEPVGRVAYNTSIEIILYYQDLVNLDMIGNSTSDVSLELLNGSWIFSSSWDAFNEYYLITVETAGQTGLQVNTPYVLWFNMSYADIPPYYGSADAYVRIQFRNRATTIELSEAPQPTPYLDSVNFTILYRDVDVYEGILGAGITVRKSGVPLVYGTDYTVTSQTGGLYLLSIDTEALNGIGPTPIAVYANWSQTAPYYTNSTLNLILTTILRYTNVEIVAPPSQTRFLDFAEFTVAVVDLGTGSTISVPLTYFKLFNGSANQLLATQFTIQDVGGNLYEITINSTILSSRLVKNHELIVSVEFPPISPFYRSDNTTARITTTNRIGSVAVGQVVSTPLGDNMQFGFSFLDESSGIGIEDAFIIFDCLNKSLVQGTDFWISGNQGTYIVSVDTDALGDVGTYRFSLSVQWDPQQQPYYLNTTTLTLTGSVRLTDTLLTSGAPDPYTVPYTDNVTIVVTFTDLDHAGGIDGAGAGITINYTLTGDIPAVWDYEALGQGRYRIVINTTDAGNPGIKTMQISIDSYPYRAAWVQISFQVRLRSGVLSAVVPDAYAGETVSVHVNLTDFDADDAPLDGASLDIVWEDSYILNALGGGIYEVNLSTSSLDWGYHTLYINANATDFKISPLAIDVYLDPLLTKVIPKAIEPVKWGDSIIISAVFNDTINGVFIEGATLIFTWAGADYTMAELTPGNYTAELNTSIVAASTYYVVIRANKTNYVSSNAQITLVVDFLDIQVTLVNGIFATVSRGDEVNMTVLVFDSDNNKPLIGASVNVYWTFNESKSASLLELGNGYYQYYVDTDDSESAESYQVIVTALKPNYRAMSEVLTLGIQQTDTEVWFDAQSQGYEDLIFNWSQVIRIGVNIVAPELNVSHPDYYLEDCMVNWKSGSYKGNLTFDGNRTFYFDFNTTEYEAGTYSFRITADPVDPAFSLSGNGIIIIVQDLPTELTQPDNVNKIWGWTGWFNFTYWDEYHDVGIDPIMYGRSVNAWYRWPGGSGVPTYFGNGVYGVFIDTSQSVPRSEAHPIDIDFELDNFVPRSGQFNLIISPIPSQITASAPSLNQIDNSTINLRVPWGDTITVGLRYATVGVNTTQTPYVGGIAGATIDSAIFTTPDGLREPFTLLEIGDGNYSFAFDTSLWGVNTAPYKFSVYLSYANRTNSQIVVSITVIDVPTSLTIEGSTSFDVEHLASAEFTVRYTDTWPSHNGAGIADALYNATSTDNTITITIEPISPGAYRVTVYGDAINERGGFFNITFSKDHHVEQTTINIPYRITLNDTDRMIGTVTNYGIPFGVLILIFAVIYNRVLKLPKRVRQLRKMINALGKGKVPKPVDDVLSRQEMVANLFNDTMKDLEITTSPERVPEFSIIVDVPEMGELLIQLAILTRLSAAELEDFRRDISKMRVSEQAAFVKEVIYQETLRVARLEHRRYEEVLEDVANQARHRLVGEDIIAVSEIDTSAIDSEPLVLTEEKEMIEFEELPTKVDELAEPKRDEPPDEAREYMKEYEIEELRSQLEARGLPREEISVIIEQVRTLPRELVDDLIKSLIGDRKEDQ